MFPGGTDRREFWQRAEDRNRNTAKIYDQLGLPEFYALEGFVQWRERLTPSAPPRNRLSIAFRLPGADPFLRSHPSLVNLALFGNLRAWVDGSQAHKS